MIEELESTVTPLIRSGARTLSTKKRKDAHFKTRKTQKKIGQVGLDVLYTILTDYVDGLSIIDLAEKHNISYKDVDDHISKLYAGLVNMRETNSLLCAQAMSRATLYEVDIAPKFKNPALVNEEFTKLLGDWSATALSPAESLYAYTYATTGDNQKAIELSGLDAGMMRYTKEGSKQSMLQLRGIYLRQKPAVSSAIEEIKQGVLEKLHVNKGMVQMELWQQVQQLKEIVADKPMQRGNLIKCIELLGKSIPGTFVERLEVMDKIDPEKSLDTLLSMAMDSIKVINPGQELLPNG